MGFLEWFTLGWGLFVVAAFLLYLLGLARTPNPDHAKDLLALVFSALTLLLGVFIQERRVQDKADQLQVAQRRAVEVEQRLADAERRLARFQEYGAWDWAHPTPTPIEIIGPDSIRLFIADTAGPDTLRGQRGRWITLPPGILFR